MANFEDYLNDFSIDGEPEEELAPPEVNASYDDFGKDYNSDYSSSEYDSYDESGSYSSDYDSADSRDSYDSEEYEEEYEDDEYEEKPKKSIKIPNISLKGSGSSGEAKSGGGKFNVTTVCLVACLILSFISILSVGSLKSDVRDMGTSLSGQIAALQASTSQLAERVSALEAGVTTVQETTVAQSSGNSQYINITKEPSSVNSRVGRGDGTEEGGQIGLFFEICANGNGVTYNSFTWYKQDASGQWVSVAFDGANSKNETLGLQHETGKYTQGDYSGSCYSKIYAVGLTSEGFGKYKCLITDSAGEKKWSQEVTISNS